MGRNFAHGNAKSNQSRQRSRVQSILDMPESPSKVVTSRQGALEITQDYIDGLQKEIEDRIYRKNHGIPAFSAQEKKNQLKDHGVLFDPRFNQKNRAMI